MTCLEAQSNIIAYIDGNLEKDKKIEFLRHIQYCEECKEELDIYYTMIEGMRQLDQNETLTKDFSKALDKKIETELKQNRNKKGIMRSSFLVILLVAFSFALIVYNNFLDLLYQEEQEKLKQAQGDYYYYETFSDYMFQPEKRELILNVEEEQPEMTFYEKVRYYQFME